MRDIYLEIIYIKYMYDLRNISLPIHISEISVSTNREFTVDILAIMFREIEQIVFIVIYSRTSSSSVMSSVRPPMIVVR